MTDTTRSGLNSISAVLAHLDGLDDLEGYDADEVELELLRDLADLVRPRTQQTHVRDVCAQAGLEMMTGVFDVILDRETVSNDVLSSITVEQVQQFYFDHVAAAIDAIENKLI